jgi:PAS domain S-box-containing protein
VTRRIPASKAIGALVAGIGAAALAEQASDAAVLRHAGPASPEMTATTAWFLVAIGIAVALLAQRHAGPSSRALRRALVALVLASAALTLVEYATDVHWVFADVLVHDIAGDSATRMPPVTAVALGASAIAVLLLDVGRAGAIAQILALATGILGFVNVVSYALTRLEPGYTAVAPHTAFALIALSIGILLARPERALMRMALAETPAGVVLRRLLPVIVTAPLVLGWMIESGRRAGLYGPEFGIALLVLGTALVLSGVIWAAAGALQRADVRRRRAERARRAATAQTDRALERTAELADANKALVETTARLRTLERLNRLVSSSLEYDAVLVAIARAAADIMAAPVVSFWIVDDAAGTVRVRAWSNDAAGADFPFPTLAIGEGMVGRVAAGRAPLHVPDVFAESQMLRARDWCTRHGLRSFYGVPVVAQDRLLAVLVLSGRAPFDLSEEDAELLHSFVAQAAVAIDNARLFGQVETRRRAAEAAEARYRELFERNLAGIFRSTRDGVLVDVNDALIRILGYGKADDLLGARAGTLYVDAAEAGRALSLRPGERLSNAECRWRRADGSTVTVLVNVAAIDAGDGEVMLEGIVVDVSDRERAAAAEREAEALRAVAQLASGAAHEINNPLAVVVADLDLLQRRFTADAQVLPRIERARTAAQRITDIVARMGRITRLRRDEASPNLPPILDLRRSSGREE